MVRTRDQRGMVTAELALGTLVVAVLVALVAWVITLVMLLTQCQDTAAEVARQEARGDAVAVSRSMSDRPSGASVHVSRQSRQVTVRVELVARPWARWLPSVPLAASATVLTEAA